MRRFFLIPILILASCQAQPTPEQQDQFLNEGTLVVCESIRQEAKANGVSGYCDVDGNFIQE